MPSPRSEYQQLKCKQFTIELPPTHLVSDSRFTENFDDSSESPSPESNSTASSPEFTPRSNSPTQLTQKFSTTSLKDTNPRGAHHHHNGVTSQPQSPAQEQMSTKTQTPDVAQHSQSDAVEMLSAKSIITLAEYLIPSLRLGADKTSKLPSTEADPTETQVNDQEHPTLDDENLPEEPNASVDGQSEAESEMSRSSSFSNQGTSTLYRTGARSLHWYQALRGGQRALGSRSKVVLRDNVTNPVYRNPSHIVSFDSHDSTSCQDEPESSQRILSAPGLKPTRPQGYD